MSDHVLNNLNKIENDIYDFGTKIAILMERLRDYMNGNILEMNENDFKIEELVTKLYNVKSDINNQVDEIYNDNIYIYKNKLIDDSVEQINSLNELIKLFSKLK